MTIGIYRGVLRVGDMSKKRKASLDIIRIIAISLVVLIHCVESTWDMSPQGLITLPIFMRIFVLTLYNIGRISVPLFLFLTGYLMLDRTYKKDEIGHFYKTKVWHLLKVTWLWIAAYYIIRVAIGDFAFNIVDFLKHSLFINETPVAIQMWYMPMIIGLYMFIPFIANALRIADEKITLLVLSLALIYLFAVPTVNSLFLAREWPAVSSHLDLSYIGGIYGVYMIIGYLVKKYSNKIKSIKLTWLMLIAASGLLLAVGWHYLLEIHLEYKYNTWYDSVFILVSSVATFLILIKQFGKAKSSKPLSKVASSVMGCYFIHVVFLYIFTHMVSKLMIGSNILYFTSLIIFVSVTTIISMTVLRRSNKIATIVGARM